MNAEITLQLTDRTDMRVVRQWTERFQFRDWDHVHQVCTAVEDRTSREANAVAGYDRYYTYAEAWELYFCHDCERLLTEQFFAEVRDSCEECFHEARHA